MPVMWDICCGSKSISKVFENHGWKCITVDIDKKFAPTICCNLLDLPVDCALGADYVHFSPPCTQYSRAHSTSKRDLDGANKLVLHCLEIIKNSYKTQDFIYWCLTLISENPLCCPAQHDSSDADGQTGEVRGRWVVPNATHSIPQRREAGAYSGWPAPCTWAADASSGLHSIVRKKIITTQ